MNKLLKDFLIKAVNTSQDLSRSMKQDCIKSIDNLELENEVLEKRLNHLLESNFISEYDKKNPLTSNYELDISELDKMMEQSEVWKKKNPSLSSNEEIFAWTFDELLKLIKQGHKRIKVTRELYAQLEDKLYKVKHNNEDPISSFFGIEIYIDL